MGEVWSWAYFSSSRECFWLLLDQLLLLFHYPPRSSGALLAGSLPLRYCSLKFASRTPFWALPVPGHAAGLITDGVRAARAGEAAVGCRVC